MQTTIQRLHSDNTLSEATVFNQVVYLAGQVPTTLEADIAVQTQEVLAAIDDMLAQANSDKQHILYAQVFIKDLADFPTFNRLWQEWLKDAPKPARATVQANLVVPEWKLEIVITAAQRSV